MDLDSWPQAGVSYHDDNLTGNIMDPRDITPIDDIINTNPRFNIEDDYINTIPGFNTIPCPIQCIPVKYENTLHIREKLLTIINKLEDPIIIDNENFKDKEIDELVEKIEGKIPKIMQLQEDLDKLDKEYAFSFEKCKKDVRVMNKSVEFMKSIEGEYDKNKEVKEIIDKLNTYSEKMLDNETLSTIKEKYIAKRKELNTSIYFIQRLNKWNTSNLCPICFTEKVDVFCNPCGHTGCRKCFDKNALRNSEEFTTNKCPFCREYIMDLKPLYYL